MGIATWQLLTSLPCSHVPRSRRIVMWLSAEADSAAVHSAYLRGSCGYMRDPQGARLSCYSGHTWKSCSHYLCQPSTLRTVGAREGVMPWDRGQLPPIITAMSCCCGGGLSLCCSEGMLTFPSSPGLPGGLLSKCPRER